MEPSEKDIFELKRGNAEMLKEIAAYDKFKFHLTDWIYHRSTGEFSNTDIDRDFNLNTTEERKIRSRCIKSLIFDETITPAGKRHGYYKLRNTNLIKMDYMKEKNEPVPVWLPFNLHRMVNIFPGNIIQINGEKNSGKTGMMLNIIKNNMHMFNCYYFNSEMGGAELRERLMLNTDVPIDSWQLEAYERASDFDQVVFNGENDINIIDFLEQHEDFWLMGKHMRNIHDNLGKSIAVVCVQLNRGSDSGLGGGRTEEKPRLILNVSPGKLKIKMAKNWATEKNPNNLFIKFKLVNGCRFQAQGGWCEEVKP